MEVVQIREALRSVDPEARRVATAALAEVSGVGVVEPLLCALGDEDWRVRTEAIAVAVALADNPAVLPALIGVFQPGDDNVGRRNAAVEAVAGFGAAAVDLLSVTLPALDADGRKLAAEALGRSGADAALVLLRSMIGDVDPNVRVAAVEALVQVGQTSVDTAVPVLESLLHEPDPMLRLAALTGLNDLGVAVPFVRIATWLEDPVLRVAALVAAGRRADPEAAPVLVAMLDGARGAVRDHVVAALVDFVRASPQSHGIVRAGFAGLGAAVAASVLEQAERGEVVERRRRFVVLLGSLGSAAAARTAVRVLADQRVAGEAEEALLALGDVAVGPLLEHVAAGSSPTRALCTELLGQLAPPLEHPAVVAGLRAVLESSVPEEVATALGALATLGDATCLGPVAARLGDPSPWVRRAAMAAVSGIAARNEVAAAAFVANARPDGDETLAAVLVMGVVRDRVRPGEHEEVAFLSQALSHGDPLVRRTALESLAYRAEPAAVEAVVFALSDEEPTVRAAAARALGKMRSAAGHCVGVESLLDLVSRSTELELVAEAVRALGEAAAPRALPLLRQQVRDGAPMVAVAAVEAVARVPSPERVDALLEGIWHDDVEVVKAALQRLAEEGDARVRPHVTACLDHDAWDVRRLAADLLGRRGGEGVTSRLKTRLAREAEPLVRQAIQRALVEIESSSSGIRRTTTSPPIRGGSGGE
ncbi:MAG: HEAT repeat domain-containing protein [Polyangiaceae bacterium]|nr:HEAT repeat domain-containing protein [Polyangiaceae bacterium]